MLIAFVLFICLIIYGLFEYRNHRKNIEKIPLRILVNGTRGKTTVTRLLAYSLMEKGIKTVSRTSGSSLEIIHSDGRVEKIERKRKPRILEMLPFFSLATKEGAEAVVVECMALEEENQRVMRDTLVRPNIVVITNTFIDHVPQMGKTQEETAWCLSRSVPKDAILYTTDNLYDDFGFKVKRVDYSNTNAPISSSIPIHPSSWALSQKVLEDLGINEDIMNIAKDKIPPDIGLLKEIKGKNGSILIPSFSVNDKECMESTIRENKEKYPDKNIAVIFNNRKDREHRIILLKEVLESLDFSLKVFIIGDYPNKVSKYLRRHKIEAYPSSPEEIGEEIKNNIDNLYIGIGNIKGDGEKLISILREDY